MQLQPTYFYRKSRHRQVLRWHIRCLGLAARRELPATTRTAQLSAAMDLEREACWTCSGFTKTRTALASQSMKRRTRLSLLVD